MGSVCSLLVLLPTLRNPVASVPPGTSLPSAVLGGMYGAAFPSMGMTLSASGSLLTDAIWSLIATLRSPGSVTDRVTARSPVLQRAPRSDRTP